MEENKKKWWQKTCEANQPWSGGCRPWSWIGRPRSCTFCTYGRPSIKGPSSGRSSSSSSSLMAGKWYRTGHRFSARAASKAKSIKLWGHTDLHQAQLLSVITAAQCIQDRHNSNIYSIPNLKTSSTEAKRWISKTLLPLQLRAMEIWQTCDPVASFKTWGT